MMDRRRLWITIAAVVGGIILILLIAIPFLLNADNYRPRVQSMLSDATGRQVTLGHLSFSLFTGSLVADQLSIADDPAFSQQPFVQAKQVHIGIEVGPLLFHKQLKIRSITIDTPKINLIQNQANVWNYASLGNSSKRSNSAETQSSMPNLSIGVLEVKDGQVTVTDLGASTPPHVIQNVQAKVSDFSLTTPFTYSLSASFPGNGTIDVSGKGGPFNQADASKTPFTAKVEVKHADLIASGFVPPSAGVAGIADLNADITSNGQTAHVQGTIDASQLKLAANGSPAPRPVHVNFTVDQNLTSLSGQLQNTTLAFGKALFNIAGTYQTQGAKTNLNVTAATQGAPVNDLEAFLPSLGIQMPSGSKLQGGTLTTNLAVTGTTDAPVITGPVRLNNTQLAGFDLASKMGPAAALVGAKPGSGTTIQILSLNLREAGGGLQAQNILLTVASLGTATGNGTVTPAKALNFHVVAKLQGGVASAATSAISMIGGAAGGLAGNALKNGIPVTITGTASSPIITPDMKGLTSGATNPASLLGKNGPQIPNTKNLGKSLGGLLGKH
ncbi:MAG TPA: AsmA family protein [Acidobacteriaceae bacterium]|jgi:AsmA protein